MKPEEVARMFGMKNAKAPPKKKSPEEWAKLFGAKLVGKVPNVGGGPLGAAYLAHVYRQRMAELRGEPAFQQLGLSEAALEGLAEMAEKESTPRKHVTPLQVAARLLEQAVRKHREAS